MPGISSIPVRMDRELMTRLAKMGRHGDTMLAHLQPEQASLLKARGGAGTINPKTGLPEFYASDNGKGGDKGGGKNDGPGNAGNDGGGWSFGGDEGLDLSGVEASYGGGATGAPAGLGRGEDGSYGGGDGSAVNEGRFADPRISQRELLAAQMYGQNYENLDDLFGGFGKRAQVDTRGWANRNIGDPLSGMARQGPGGFIADLAMSALGMGGLNALAGMAGYGAGDLVGGALGESTPTARGDSITGMAGTNEMGVGKRGGNGTAPGTASGDQDGLGIASLRGDAPAPEPSEEGKDEGKAVEEEATLKYLPKSWDEEDYLSENPRVAAAVQSGIWRSGYDFDRAYRNTYGQDYMGGDTPLLRVKHNQAVFPGEM